MRLFTITLLSLLTTALYSQTCDLDFISYNPINHEVEVAFLDATNCGCNEYTQQDGNTCENSLSVILNNNESVTSLVFGIHYDSFDYDSDCSSSTQFHPGWNYVVTYSIDDPWETGDTAVFELNPGFGWECVLNNPVDSLCWEIVIWQINLSQSADINDFPNEYWTDTCGTCANQTQMYPDIDLSNNSLIFCPWDEFEVYGCMYEDAINYDELATIDDGSCEYEPCPIYGCMSPTACNYDQYATINQGCVFCDTPGGESICNEYHNSDTYWDWYVSLFDCEEVELGCDTIIEYVYDTITITIPEVVYDTLIIVDVVDNFIYDTTYIELPPDTIVVTEIEYLTDTIYVDNFIYEYDTIYIDVPYIDTIYVTETEYITDTLYVTEWVTITDTITEYIVQEVWIDCNTGLPCGEEPPGMECPDWTTLHIPNTFTPNNDGVNDVWQIVHDLECWEDIEFWIYNRWGNLIYHDYGSSFDSYPFWDGSVNGGDHYVQDGTYVYIVQGKKVGRVDVVKEQGHLTIFR